MSLNAPKGQYDNSPGQASAALGTTPQYLLPLLLVPVWKDRGERAGERRDSDSFLERGIKDLLFPSLNSPLKIVLFAA
jgi:hypothetical protein